MENPPHPQNKDQRDGRTDTQTFIPQLHRRGSACVTSFKVTQEAHTYTSSSADLILPLNAASARGTHNRASSTGFLPNSGPRDAGQARPVSALG